MVKNIFRLGIFFMLATCALAIFTPILSVNSFLFPVRIDSAYVSQQQITYEKQVAAGKTDSIINFIYSPGQLEINYVDVVLTMTDSVQLRGWLSIDTSRMQSPLLLLIPDISEGAINYIPALKQFCDRGFNVCVMDMRGQGMSDGEYYNPGTKATNDVCTIIRELKKMPFIDQVALFGSGTGAGIALKTVVDSAVADVVVLQNIPYSLTRLVKMHALNEWGIYLNPFTPVALRSYERKTGIDLDDFNYRDQIKKLNIPQLFVTANFYSKKNIDEMVDSYHASTYNKKRLYIDTHTFLRPMGLNNDKKYYDQLATFMNSSFPSKSKKTRFRKLAFDTLTK